VQYLQPIRLLNLVLTAAFILGIISGVWTNPTSNNIDTGYKLRRASSILFAVSALVIFGIALFFGSRSRSREQRMDLVLAQIYIVMPILIMRMIYATVQAFLSGPTNPGHDVWVYLALLLIPDFVAMTIYTVCGFLIKPSTRRIAYDNQPSPKVDDVPLQNDPYGQTQPSYQEPGVIPAANTNVPPSGYTGRRQRRRRGGPIRMLIGYIMDKTNERRN
jgi:hypothetical protein